ncbi:hypothetical protein Noc_0677 [Nitrosococcus oceani ATCC 19707]|uniref:Periplasmic heavy metal sensor n=1 Tax=Nitrosococcus oceani (strain ATCC 19707 / BCRC 17464 / JCM 30415 / NCIMB 11848 / C-107) TaxID=323261 RepID=Q3JDA0_NITOC|nr:Spy/CpxP family protein refolding chaperone [Nitrosococcus oceani]ABA57196.1 hypothetical protein Noc_0677 [Nitrosococcus oceani ATCC 19707]GEM21513.1 hypothetical protein NONS58_29570 [Nitrosococcus oceani]
MKKSSKALLASMLIVSSLGLVATVSAKQHSDRPDCKRDGHHMGAGYKHGDKGFNVDRMARKLDLGDDQRTQIEAIMEASKQQMSDQRDKMQANREQLRSLTTQSPLDEAAVRTVADAQGDLEADMIVLRAQQRAKINAILTDEQRAELEDMGGKKRGHR